MRTYNFLLLCFLCIGSLQAQTPMKQLTPKPVEQSHPFQPALTPKGTVLPGRQGATLHPTPLVSLRTKHEAVKSIQLSSSGSIWMDLHENELWDQRSSIRELLSLLLHTPTTREVGSIDWSVDEEIIDERHNSHIRVRQTLAGIPIHRQDMVLHIENGKLRDLNGFVWTGRLPDEMPSPLATDQAMNAARQYLMSKDVKFQAKPHLDGFHHATDKITLIWYPKEGHLVSAYEIEIHPNTMDHWKVYVESTTLEVIEAYSQLCSLAPLQLYDLSCYHAQRHIVSHPDVAPSPEAINMMMDGATTVSDQDLFGLNRTVNGYQVGATFYMIDASRTGMFNSTQSVMPNEPVGTIWTIDGQNGSPSLPSFELIHVSNTNNNWRNLDVSAHFNGGEAYEYFRQKFNRNSINGAGGNIISIINVADENGNDMDNAFWNGAAMFYGNGDVAFNQPLAKALDVAGHEMSHGVIQNTANLEYVGQSGALNESFADIFGAMIDRDDWKMGEDVSNPNVFPTGALRDLSNPNNGGNQLGDPGWQPAHMNQFQNLPNTPEGDNGGVHVNSGIANRAFFLLATNIGKEKAEQIYYKALRDYLVMSSQFIDMRNAAQKAAEDLHGANSTEVNAVRAAFDGVGIGAGQGEDYEEDIETNDGDDFIIVTDQAQSDLYWVPPTNPSQFVKMNVPAPISRPSFTDDGVSCVYVDTDNNMILINFNWSVGLDYEAFYLEPNPQGIWQNVVVSKDGSKIAYTRSNLTNEIQVFDFNSGNNQVYELYNPTTAQGGFNTGDVLYPDVMEWDYSGEYLMYDALNRLESAFGDGIQYWDISFLNVWNNATDNFGSGQVSKLFSALPENISVGNPSFAKNSPFIIVFDYLEEYFDLFGQLQTDYRVKAANFETGDVNDIYVNTTVGYPSYSRLDNQISFTYDDVGTLLVAIIDVQNSNKTLPVIGSEVVLITQAQKSVWFSVGNRDFTSTKDGVTSPGRLSVSPQPASDFVRLESHHLIGGEPYVICDLAGRVILQGSLQPKLSVGVSSLVPGTYVIRLRAQDGSSFYARFVKQ